MGLISSDSQTIVNGKVRLKMSDSKMFVCLTTTIMLSDRSMVAPGTPFRREDVVPATLVSMLKHETIQAFNPESPPAPLPRYPIGKTELGIKREGKEKEPISNIGLHRRPPETKSDETRARKVLVKAKLKALGVTMPHNTRLDTLESRLSKEQVLTAECAARIGTPGPVQSVWDADPEELAEIPEDQLLTAYRGRCEEFGVTMQKFDTKELLIEYMSSQFVKK